MALLPLLVSLRLRVGSGAATWTRSIFMAWAEVGFGRQTCGARFGPAIGSAGRGQELMKLLAHVSSSLAEKTRGTRHTLIHSVTDRHGLFQGGSVDNCQLHVLTCNYKVRGISRIQHFQQFCRFSGNPRFQIFFNFNTF